METDCRQFWLRQSLSEIVIYGHNDYGKCSVCKKPFKYGDTVMRIQKIVKGTSQGYPTEYVQSSFTYCADCVLHKKFEA